ncbi:protein FAR1-RELATED SEQUENCE 5-like [Chenopodium quinoa]|uniref:protein FAR1-RELATED SEQUENCE 5-like n=1 Tax=Chenopodium quinoa TaxID=63459 RepID=UPI000B77F51D|nr:protein FAR1-RELATED SEQUENCE 5-like [Chenopodium quinoa]
MVGCREQWRWLGSESDTSCGDAASGGRVQRQRKEIEFGGGGDGGDEMISNNEQCNGDFNANGNVPFTPTVVVTPKVAPLLTPRGTKEWIPLCSNELKLALGMKFNNVDEDLAFYKAYAYAAGFNTRKDLKAYIQGSDAQMFVDNFTNKKLMWSAFFFDFEMDEDYCLCRALWADPPCKKSYALFGDIVSFDTTYQTNRYNMFTPFTGVDHHKSCITFIVGFIAKEDIVSFEWMFRSFLKAMGGNEPNCMITDQDPAMKIAIKSVFKNTEHRFCMWHIMKKLPDKVEKSIMQEETGFLNKICDCVWHLEIEPAEFEERWNKVMVEYHLKEHEWLGYLYNIRDKWIPAYFRDVFLGGIMRTTSRSESENNFFCSFINPHVSLVEFYLRYEATIDAQRHTQGQNDNDSKHKYPECKTPLGIEKHASHLYTNSVFYEFQYEKENGLEVAKKAKGFKTIPEQYMLHRWTTMALKKPIFDLGGNLLEQCANLIDKKKLLNDLWSEIHTCVSLAEGKDEDIQDLVINIQGIRKD